MGGRVITGFGGRAVIVVVTLLTIRNVAGPELPDGWYVPVNLFTAALLLVVARAAGLTWASLGLAHRRWRTGLAVGLVAAGIAVAVMMIGTVLPITRPFFGDQRVDVAAGGGELAYQTLLRIPVGTVLFEEVAFRGVLLALLVRQTGTRVAVVASSLLFGLWHIVPALSATATNDIAGIIQVGAVVGAVALTTVGGVIFCAVRLRAEHLLAPVLLHLAFNNSGYLLSWWLQT